MWAPNCWRHAIPRIRAQGHEIVGMWIVPDRLAGKTGSAVPAWYFKTFGPLGFAALATYAITVRVAGLLHRRPTDLADLCGQSGIPLRHAEHASASKIANWVKAERIDIVVIMVGDIVKPELIEAPRLGVINKHAALLPAHRGLFPYVHAKIAGTRQGVSFHRVTVAIDRGELLATAAIDPPEDATLLSFYRAVFDRYSTMICEAIANLASGQKVEPIYPGVGSYHSLPTRAELRAFHAKGGRVAAWKDYCTALLE